MPTPNDIPSNPDAAPRMFPALKLMERAVPPARYGRPPYWRPPVMVEPSDVFVPSWNWHTVHDFPDGTELVTLDTNGAFLGAIGNVTIAHSQLSHTGPWEHPTAAEVLPGYYRVTVPYWAFGGTIVSPLGDSSRLQTESSVWVAAPTTEQMLQLAETGHIGAFDIIDSYTARITTSFRSWYARLRAERERRLDAVEASHPDGVRPPKCKCVPCAGYVAFKEGYSAALSMILVGTKCATHRPDWAQTVYAAHAANQWRKAWNYSFTGDHIISMGHVDELTVPRAGLQAAMQRTPPPFRLDTTGRRIGALKIKRTGTIAEAFGNEPRPLQDSPSWEDPGEDIV